MPVDTPKLETSHLILHVADTDATIDFWCRSLGGVLESDEELEAPALDAIFGRSGVRIRDTFIAIAGLRLHTIETLDVPRTRASLAPFEKPIGLSGLSFRVDDLDAAHARAQADGRSPTEIHAFDDLDHPVRMFFVEDPNGLRIEMIGNGP
ncbi:MAG: VOC family protein [Spirochaetaceae bacterium]|nr:VOC family protein [Myxococcales bacterium]MCB9725838.1 VOC family protein [Spirochaetaceae bacterium]HPG25994.1 VOC family protein [Myxococcota bacterium]